jgi:hypothetical protein
MKRTCTWNWNHQAHQISAATGANGLRGVFNKFGNYNAPSNFPGPFRPDYLRSSGVKIGGWDYGGRFEMGSNESSLYEC